MKYLVEFLIDKPSVLTTFNNLYKLFISNNLEQLLYDTGIGQTVVSNDGDIINGIRNIFLFNTDVKGIEVSQFLSSGYVVNIFVSLGLLLNLYYKIEKESRLALVFLTFGTIISGNNLMISLFLLLINPISYVGYLFLCFLSNVIIRFVDIRIGFRYFQSVFELIKYIEKPIYFIIIGIIFTALSYYIFELTFSRLNVKNDFFIDRNAKRIVMSLGGIKNIAKIDDEVVIVKNPNLINILKLDCEIYNNKVILLDNDLDVLKEYL